MKYDAILLVAGSGTRMQSKGNKVVLPLGDKPVFLYSLECFLGDQDCETVILVGKPEERSLFEPYLSKRVRFVTGGKERQDSVYQGIMVAHADFVMIHDGARPFVTPDDLSRLKKVPNSILAVPVKETVKQASQGKVDRSLSREGLYLAQTPQFFEKELMRKVHHLARKEQVTATDDAMLVEKFSDQVVSLILGSGINIKLTTKEDLAIAEGIVRFFLLNKGRKSIM